MRRREFIAALGGAAAWPLAARAQQPPMPVIGFLHTGREAANRRTVASLRQGLLEAGYVEGRNVTIEFRWANFQIPQLPMPVNDLVHRQAAVIVAAGGFDSVQAAMRATSAIPIVSTNGFDLVKYGFAKSLNRPGGNITGMTVLSADLMGKRVGLLHELLPDATTFAFLAGPSRGPVSEDQKNDALSAANTVGLDVFVISVGSERGLAAAFATLVERGASALIVGSYQVLLDYGRAIVALAAQHKIPAIYPAPGYVQGGGLMSYGADIGMARQVALQYVGPILKGSNAAELPIQQATEFKLAINLNTAKALGLTIPPNLLAIADEVIE
jgi:putative ABC transport system substrate-binding protein